MMSNFKQIYMLLFLFFLTNFSYLNAHNLFNGGCNDLCQSNVEAITNEIKLKKNNGKNLIVVIIHV